MKKWTKRQKKIISDLKLKAQAHFILKKTSPSVLGEVFQERIRQHLKWGTQHHNPSYWTHILGEEYGESCKEVNNIVFGGKSRDDLKKELIQTAAVCVAWIEHINSGHKDIMHHPEVEKVGRKQVKDERKLSKN